LAAGTEKVRDLRWAIGDLETKSSDSWLDTPSRPSAANAARMRWLIDNEAYDLPNHLRPLCHQGHHSYVSMYGRLNWKDPAQTITSGFGSMGQGRFVHPSLPRTLTPHEAARIQGFPDYFRFDSALTRTELAVIIGNAVPPALASTLVARLIAAEVFGADSSSRPNTQGS
jgi:DNA (cytosine-5)-methyltransferase 1